MYELQKKKYSFGLCVRVNIHTLTSYLKLLIISINIFFNHRLFTYQNVNTTVLNRIPILIQLY